MGTHPIFESDFDCLTAFRMEIICAGYPKTGSKSCSAALRVLGYNVADYIETLEFFGETWQDFFDGKIDAKAVLDKYKEEGFDANQDFPGNFLWEELYQVSPAGQKVILTVRDSDEKWWKSWCGFFTQESKRHAIGDINLGIILNKASEYGYMGPKFQVMFEVGKLVCSRYLSPALFDTKWSVQKQIEMVTREETRLKRGYRKHNAYVIATVPKENLLVWNLKEGWEPLCKFLNKPIPNEPIPHDNRTGDKEFMERYILNKPIFKEAGTKFMRKISLDFIKIGLIGYVGYKTYTTNGDWLYLKMNCMSESF